MLRESELKGFNIPGITKRVLTSLFADDTSTFLSALDRWNDLWRILHQWCQASGAKFNDGKTEVIPVGRPQYRHWVQTNRRINVMADEDVIPDTVHIARDGEATRILGAWIGNKTDQVAIWAPTVHKIKIFIKRWGRCHPSLTGKKHIVQMGPGGISQYLARVQGMPPAVAKELKEMIRDFVWNNTKPMVNMETLALPRDQG
ncbi:hypothetical protein FOMPIDRAFT_18859, partial [Fomitopsis schrenkii]